jgi:hypothetical protein
VFCDIKIYIYKSCFNQQFIIPVQANMFPGKPEAGCNRGILQMYRIPKSLLGYFGLVPFLRVLQNSYRILVMRFGSNFANNYGQKGGGNYQVMGIPQPIIYALALHLIFLFHMELLHKVSISGQIRPPVISRQIENIKSPLTQAAKRFIRTSGPKDANLNSKKHNPTKLLGFSPSMFTELQQTHHVSAAVCVGTTHHT